MLTVFNYASKENIISVIEVIPQWLMAVPPSNGIHAVYIAWGTRLTGPDQLLNSTGFFARIINGLISAVASAVVQAAAGFAIADSCLSI